MIIKNWKPNLIQTKFKKFLFLEWTWSENTSLHPFTLWSSSEVHGFLIDKRPQHDDEILSILSNL